jgi:hypothetical protein
LADPKLAPVAGDKKNGGKNEGCQQTINDRRPKEGFDGVDIQKIHRDAVWPVSQLPSVIDAPRADAKHRSM